MEYWPKFKQDVPVEEAAQVVTHAFGGDRSVQAHALAWQVQIEDAQSGPRDVQRQLDQPVLGSSQLVETGGQTLFVSRSQQRCERDGVVVHTKGPTSGKPPAADTVS